MGEGNIESMLSVEMGLRELSSLKVLTSFPFVSRFLQGKIVVPLRLLLTCRSKHLHPKEKNGVGWVGGGGGCLLIFWNLSIT